MIAGSKECATYHKSGFATRAKLCTRPYLAAYVQYGRTYIRTCDDVMLPKEQKVALRAYAHTQLFCAALEVCAHTSDRARTLML